MAHCLPQFIISETQMLSLSIDWDYINESNFVKRIIFKNNNMREIIIVGKHEWRYGLLELLNV